MRIAAVAFVLIVGAAIVLAFANTLNSWVLGGLLGGLAAILLCIPISLAIFMVLTRRHEARQHAEAEALAEAEAANEFDEDELMVYEAEGYALPMDEEYPLPDARMRSLPAHPRAPVSGYLALPPAEQETEFYEEDEIEMPARHEPRNYPRQPRYPARALTPRDGLRPSQSSPTGSTRHPSTRSLAQHQSAALHRARQEALRQQRSPGGSTSLGGRAGGSRAASHTQRSRTSRALHGQEATPEYYRPEDDYETRRPSTRSAWQEEDERAAPSSTEDLDERYPQYPRRSTYPRPRRSRGTEPWTGQLQDEEEPRSRRAPRDPDRLSGSLRNPLVRRAPYLYEDDLLNEEFARQLDNDHPITRRSSRYDFYQEDDQE